MKISTILVMLLTCCLSFCATAQKGSPTDNNDFTPAQMAAITAWQKELNQRIEKGFAGNEKLKNQMTSELKSIGDMKDAKAQATAADAYRKKYLKDYTAVLTKAGVNLNDEVAKLKKIIPTYEIVLLEYQIIAKQEIESSASAPPAPKSVKITGLDEDETVDCGQLSSGFANFTGTSIKTGAGSVGTGFCSAKGIKSKSVAVSAASAASIVSKFKAAIDGFALGIGGPASAKPSVSVSVGGQEIFSLSHHYFAIVSWVANGSESKTKTITTSVTPNTSPVISLSAKSSANALASSHTNAHAELTNIDLTLNTN